VATPVHVPSAGLSPSTAATTSTVVQRAQVAARSVQGGGSSGGGGTSQAAQQHAAARQAAIRNKRETRNVRRSVLRLRGCLSALPARQGRYLHLRAGVGRPHAMGRAAAARAVGIRGARSRGFERRALAALHTAHRQSGCGAGTSQGAAPAHGLMAPVMALASASSSDGTGAAQAGTQGAQQGDGQQHVLGRSQSNPDKPQRTRDQTLPVLPPTIASAPTGTGDVNPALMWAAAALAALAALAGGSLVRRRSRLTAAVATPLARRHSMPAAFDEPPAPEFAVVAPVPVPARAPDDQQELVRRIFAALSAGDVDSAAATLHPDVKWPDPPEGTIVGRKAFSDRWRKRLEVVTVQTEPVRFEPAGNDLLVEVNETVRNRKKPQMIGEYRAARRFSFRDGLIAEMRRGRS
jgi:ketosteroid isomerase-like protein